MWVKQNKQNKQKKQNNTKDLDYSSKSYKRFCNKLNSAREIVEIDGDETHVLKKLEKMWQEDFFKLKNAADKKKRKSIAVKARYKEM
jgi:hypothetical protein